jgi:adenylate cyclase
MWPWSEIRRLKTALRLYAGQHVLAKLEKDGERFLCLGGTRRQLTLMFVDIAVTPSDQEQTADLIGQLLYRYLDSVTTCLVEHSGVIDAYVGDSISAWWEDPDQEPNALNACTCAKAIVSRVALINDDPAFATLPKLKIKIGVHSGLVTLGNYGSYQRMRYAALGDAVNLASSLCSLANATVEAPIVISAATQQLLAGRISVTELAPLRVKGRDEPLPLFAINAL